MTQTHTPGPWQALIDGQNTRKPNKDPHPMAMVSTFSGSQCIDATGSGANWAESAANARLIAAAPDMLAALQAAMNVMRSDPHAREARAIAAAAIAKATGEK